MFSIFDDFSSNAFELPHSKPRIRINFRKLTNFSENRGHFMYFWADDLFLVVNFKLWKIFQFGKVFHRKMSSIFLTIFAQNNPKWKFGFSPKLKSCLRPWFEISSMLHLLRRICILNTQNPKRKLQFVGPLINNWNWLNIRLDLFWLKIKAIVSGVLAK